MCANTAGSVHIQWPRTAACVQIYILHVLCSTAVHTSRTRLSLWHSGSSWVVIQKNHRATSNHYKLSIPCCLIVLASLTVPLSAGKWIGPHFPPSLDAFCLLVQQIPAYCTVVVLSPSAAPTFSLQELCDLYCFPLAYLWGEYLPFCSALSSLVIYSSSTAPCTLTIMSVNILCTLNRWCVLPYLRVQ